MLRKNNNGLFTYGKMQEERINEKAVRYLKRLCEDISDRSVGCPGNREATRFFENRISSSGWKTEVTELDVIDWQDEGATLHIENEQYDVLASPYSLGCTVQAQLINASTISELEQVETTGKVLLLHGEIAKEQLMPKNFVFCNQEEHQKIIALLEEKQPSAIIAATGRNAALAGGVYPIHSSRTEILIFLPCTPLKK